MKLPPHATEKGVGIPHQIARTVATGVRGQQSMNNLPQSTLSPEELTALIRSHRKFAAAVFKQEEQNPKPPRKSPEEEIALVKRTWLRSHQKFAAWVYKVEKEGYNWGDRHVHHELLKQTENPKYIEEMKNPKTSMKGFTKGQKLVNSTWGIYKRFFPNYYAILQQPMAPLPDDLRTLRTMDDVVNTTEPIVWTSDRGIVPLSVLKGTEGEYTTPEWANPPRKTKDGFYNLGFANPDMEDSDSDEDEGYEKDEYIENLRERLMLTLSHPMFKEYSSDVQHLSSTLEKKVNVGERTPLVVQKTAASSSSHIVVDEDDSNIVDVSDSKSTSDLPTMGVGFDDDNDDDDALETLTNTSDVDQSIPALSLRALKEADARARKSENRSTKIDSGTGTSGMRGSLMVDDGTSFLLDVKNRVEAIHSGESQRLGLGALEKQEMLFDIGAVLSASEDSQGSDDSMAQSIRSDEAVVQGTFHGQRALDAIKKQLQREGCSKDYIDREMLGHARADEIAAAHRVRRNKKNSYMLRKKKEIQLQKEKKEVKTKKIDKKNLVESVNQKLRKSSTSIVRSPFTRIVLSSERIRSGSPPSPDKGSLRRSSDSPNALDSPGSHDIRHDASASTTTAAETLPPTSPCQFDSHVNVGERETRETGKTGKSGTTINEVLSEMSKESKKTVSIREEKKSRKRPIAEITNSEAKYIGTGKNDEDRIVEKGEIRRGKSSILLKEEKAKHGRGSPTMKKNYTHDEKLIARKNQKCITAMFADLQKKLHRGDLTQGDFEEEKSKLFGEIFGVNDNGRVYVKETSASGVQKTKRGLKNFEETFLRRRRRKGAFRMPGWKDAEETDAALEEDDDADDGQLYDDDDEDEEDRIGTWVELPNDHYDPPKALDPRSKPNESSSSFMPTESAKRRKLTDKLDAIVYGENRRLQFERREMLMRKFDQRAPPQERMFHQDTSVRHDGLPTASELKSWDEWHIPLNKMPTWMNESSDGRQLIFPPGMKGPEVDIEDDDE